MSAIKSIDHQGKEFPSFAAMCRHWEKKTGTVKRRLNNSFYQWPLEMALEIPEIPGYKFRLVMIGFDGTLRFQAKINQNYKQYQQYNNKFFTFDEIKKYFPKTQKDFYKGRLLRIY